LDAILLAQEQVWLFYNGFDLNDGEVREPSSVLQGFRDHLALIVKPTSREDGSPLSEVDLAGLKALQVPAQLYPLYHLHRYNHSIHSALFRIDLCAFKTNGLRSLHRFSR
jgi:exodeoxyribonuclease V gamma subunit